MQADVLLRSIINGSIPPPKRLNMENRQMRKEYDFSDARPGRFADKAKQQITIRLDAKTITYFKTLSETVGVPYQTLINMYLSDCAEKKKMPEFV
jgi:predicted DNA binding CopG/RHH family protein